MSGAPARRAYVVMPFARSFDALYEANMRPAAIEAGFAVARFDEMEMHGSVSARIARGIQEADIILGVVTGRNANVFYEIGFARAIGKTILILASARDEIPAFLEDLPCIVYGASSCKLREVLATALRGVLDTDCSKAQVPGACGLVCT